MTDIFSRTKRREIMQCVRSHSTTPEMIVRRLLTAMGYRYRLNVRRLAGSPDVVLSGLRKAIFVHGCYWHRHRCKRGRSMPSSNRAFWEGKFQKNIDRDRRVRGRLRKEGWEVLVVWECQTGAAAREKLERRLREFLEG